MILLALGGLVLVAVVVGYLIFRFVYSPSNRWGKYLFYVRGTDGINEFTLLPGERCEDAPFAWPTRGVAFGLWGESYRPWRRHQGIDIFPGSEPGVTPVYAAYPGYLSRNVDWISTVIIRLPNDPLNPNRQIWTYYTHMADVEGNSFVSSEFPPGTYEVFVEGGTFLGYVGNYSGDPVNPTGIHLHLSIVKDDGSGTYLNEIEIDNTLDPSPYFNLPLNDRQNPDTFPVCVGEVTQDAWNLVPDND
jgi:hypothetical protein